jgi:hypothetical protein
MQPTSNIRPGSIPPAQPSLLPQKRGHLEMPDVRRPQSRYSARPHEDCHLTAPSFESMRDAWKARSYCAAWIGGVFFASAMTQPSSESESAIGARSVAPELDARRRRSSQPPAADSNRENQVVMFPSARLVRRAASRTEMPAKM